MGAVAMVLAACETNRVAPPDPNAPAKTIDPQGRLNVGDYVSVSFSGVTTPPEKFDGKIKEDGTISLPLIGSVSANGKTTGELEDLIRSRYVPKYFNNLNVVVNSENRYYSVAGEVKMPSRQIYIGRTTVLSAVASAGGFTDFAAKHRVQLIRSDGKTLVVDCKKALKKPELDLEVYPLDRIWVPRRIM